MECEFKNIKFSSAIELALPVGLLLVVGMDTTNRVSVASPKRIL